MTEQDGVLIIKLKNDDDPLEFPFNTMKGWELWGSWVIVKYHQHRLMYSGSEIEWIDVVYNSDEVAAELAKEHTEDDDPVATRYSCVSCHEKIRVLPIIPPAPKA